MSMVKQITVRTNEIYDLVFLKETILNRSLKGAIIGSFCRAPSSLPSFIKKSAKLKCLNKLL